MPPAEDVPLARSRARSVRAALAELPAGTKVVFTGGPRSEAAAVAAEAGLGPWASWGLAGPAGSSDDLVAVVHGLVASGRATGVLVCALGPEEGNGEDPARAVANAAGLPYHRIS